jgi:hypothetical protein
MTKRFLWPLAAALAAFPILGCGDSTGPGAEGTFEVRLGGEFSEDLDGTAEFGIFVNEGFGLSMTPSQVGHLLGLGHREEARPAVGTFTIGSPNEEGVFFALYMRQTPQGLATFLSREGELEITSSTESRLEGAFWFTARGTLPGEPGEREVLVEATFSASCASGARCE